MIKTQNRITRKFILITGITAALIFSIYNVFMLFALSTGEKVRVHRHIYPEISDGNSDIKSKDGNQFSAFKNGNPIKGSRPAAKMGTTESGLLLWPDPKIDSDRIANQLKFRLSWSSNNGQAKFKKIFLYHGKEIWEVEKGRTTFLKQGCSVSTCELTWISEDFERADAVLFRNHPIHVRKPNTQSQTWIFFTLESPYNTRSLRHSYGLFNWTATYRHDSDIVAPYEKFQLYDGNVETLPQNRSYASGKIKKVAWFVSNCNSRNKRIDYVKELANYIEVDVYGECGKLQCPKGENCFEMIRREYKFYLSFENSNCRDYITEKFFINALRHDVIPIVMGAAPEDYARAAPHGSYIHVDDFDSPQSLADYLHTLDQNDKLYNEYFKWKGTGEFINTYFWCRVCAMLHEESRGSHVYEDLERWWRGGSVCIGNKMWRDIPRYKSGR